MRITPLKISALRWDKDIHRAVGDRKGLTRYGHAYVPLDEAFHAWCWIFPVVPVWYSIANSCVAASVTSMSICS